MININNTGNPLFVGVDPAFRDSGYWVCIIQKNETIFSKIKQFTDFIQLIDFFADNNFEAHICIENSNETNNTFIGGNKSPAVREKMSRDVGKNQAISQISVDYALLRLKIGVYSVSPAEKGMKWNHYQTLLAARENGLTLNGYKGLVTEQDKRDALKLALRARWEYLCRKKK